MLRLYCGALIEEPSIEVEIKIFFKTSGWNQTVRLIRFNDVAKIITFRLLFGNNDFQLDFSNQKNIKIKCKGMQLFDISNFQCKKFFTKNYAHLLKYDIQDKNTSIQNVNVTLDNNRVTLTFDDKVLIWNLPQTKTENAIFRMSEKLTYSSNECGVYSILHLKNVHRISVENKEISYAEIIRNMLREIEAPLQRNYVIKGGEKIHVLLENSSVGEHSSKN